MLGLDCVNAKYRNTINMPQEEDFLAEGETAVEVYHYLLSLGYCPKLKGIIFFKEMIVSIIYKITNMKSLDGEEMQELLAQINSPYSQFYLDLSRNRYDIGVKTYHEYLTTSLALNENELAGPKAFDIAVKILQNRGLEINIRPMVLSLKSEYV